MDQKPCAEERGDARARTNQAVEAALPAEIRQTQIGGQASAGYAAPLSRLRALLEPVATQ
jgi:hypothetical protein